MIEDVDIRLTQHNGISWTFNLQPCLGVFHNEKINTISLEMLYFFYKYSVFSVFKRNTQRTYKHFVNKENMFMLLKNLLQWDNPYIVLNLTNCIRFLMSKEKGFSPIL